MASYFNLTLDTLAPAGLVITLNDGALFTTTQTVTLKTEMTDVDSTGYQMKVWGVDGAETEDAASWETFQAEKAIVLTAGDGLKTVHVKVRDDVWNESTEVTDDITLNTAVPAITVTGPDVSRLSKVDGKNTAIVSFTVDVPFLEYKVCVVPAVASLEDAGMLIPVTAGSINTSGIIDRDTDPDANPFPADTPISVTIKGADLETAGADTSGDVPAIVKVFAKSEAGIWSVA